MPTTWAIRSLTWSWAVVKGRPRQRRRIDVTPIRSCVESRRDLEKMVICDGPGRSRSMWICILRRTSASGMSMADAPLAIVLGLGVDEVVLAATASLLDARLGACAFAGLGHLDDDAHLRLDERRDQVVPRVLAELVAVRVD